MDITRITRKWATLNFAVTSAAGQPVTVNDVAVALLPQRSTPDDDTEWTTVSNGPDGYRVLLAGPDADPNGAMVVATSLDLWARIIDTPEVDAAKVDRINVK